VQGGGPAFQTRFLAAPGDSRTPLQPISRRSFGADNWIPRATPVELQIFPLRENFPAGAFERAEIPAVFSIVRSSGQRVSKYRPRKEGSLRRASNPAGALGEIGFPSIRAAAGSPTSPDENRAESVISRSRCSVREQPLVVTPRHFPEICLHLAREAEGGLLRAASNKVLEDAMAPPSRGRFPHVFRWRHSVRVLPCRRDREGSDF